MYSMRSAVNGESMLHYPSNLVKPHSSKNSRRQDKTVSVMNILVIPRIWISFLTFIVATACNGFLSIHLEPKVGQKMEKEKDASDVHSKIKINVLC